MVKKKEKKISKKKPEKKDNFSIVRPNSIIELHKNIDFLKKEIYKKGKGLEKGKELEISKNENLTSILMLLMERLAILEPEYKQDMEEVEGLAKKKKEQKDLIISLKQKWATRGRYFDGSNEVLILKDLINSWADKKGNALASFEAGVSLSSLNKYIHDVPAVNALKNELKGRTIKKLAEEVMEKGLDHLKQNPHTTNTTTQALKVLQSVAPDEYSTGRTQVDTNLSGGLEISDEKKNKVRELWEEED